MERVLEETAIKGRKFDKDYREYDADCVRKNFYNTVRLEHRGMVDVRQGGLPSRPGEQP